MAEDARKKKKKNFSKEIESLLSRQLHVQTRMDRKMSTMSGKKKNCISCELSIWLKLTGIKVKMNAIEEREL